MKEKSLFLEFFGESPLTRVLDFLIENYRFEYLKKEIAEGADISRITLYKIWPYLEVKKVVKPTRKVGKATFYQLNVENEIVKKLFEIDKKLINDFAHELTEKRKVMAKISS